MNRTTATLAGGLAAAAVLSIAAPAGATSVKRGDQAERPSSRREVVIRQATDLQPGTANATDGAWLAALGHTGRNGTSVLLVAGGLDPAAAGTTFGAHVHTGPCVAGDGAAAGPHWAGGTPPSPDTEIWLDLTVNRLGGAWAVAVNDLTVPPGATGSIVVHALPTDPAGAAGGRLACIPFSL